MPTDEISLRPVTAGDAELLERWLEPPYTGEFNLLGAPRRLMRAESEETAPAADLGGMLVVLVGAKPIGTVSWRAVRYGPTAESTAWNIGINLIPEGRGMGYGGKAQRLLADHLFRATTMTRVEAMTDVDNIAEQRALEKAGFVREGVLRQAQFRAGGHHDLVVYALVREDV